MSASSHPALAYPKGPTFATERRRVRRQSAHEISELRGQVMDRDHWRCRVPWCRSQTFVELAHLVPLSLGGQTHRQNCAAICHRCHRDPRGSLHAGDLRFEFETDRGADGGIRFSMVSYPAPTGEAA